MDSIMNNLRLVQAQLGSLFGGLFGGLIAVLVEASAWMQDVYTKAKRQLDALEKRVKVLEDATTASSSTTAAESAFDTAIDTLLANSNITVQAGAGTSGASALYTGGGTGESNSLRNAIVRITGGTGSMATGAQFRVTPPATVKGPIRVKLSPAPGASGGTVFDNDPYYTVNYGSDGQTVSSIDISVATALTSATVYDVQFSIEKSA